jgi:hypothetical protein
MLLHYDLLITRKTKQNKSKQNKQWIIDWNKKEKKKEQDNS